MTLITTPVLPQEKTLFMAHEFLMQYPFHEFEGNNKVVLIINQYTSGSQYIIVRSSYVAAFKIKYFKEPITNNPPIFLLLVKIKGIVEMA